MMKQIIIVALTTSLVSCHTGDIQCGKDLLEINKKYDEMSLLYRGDNEQLRTIYELKLKEIEALDCY